MRLEEWKGREGGPYALAPLAESFYLVASLRFGGCFYFPSWLLLVPRIGCATRDCSCTSYVVSGIVPWIEIGLTEQTILTLLLLFSRQVDLCRNRAEPTRDGGELHPMGYYWVRDAVLCPEEVLSLLGKV